MAIWPFRPAGLAAGVVGWHRWPVRRQCCWPRHARRDDHRPAEKVARARQRPGGAERHQAAEMARPSLTRHYLSRLWPYAD